jgi:hypothetical protein
VGMNFIFAHRVLISSSSSIAVWNKMLAAETDWYIPCIVFLLLRCSYLNALIYAIQFNHDC